MRYFIHFSYDGTAYHGWQMQPNAQTVQEVLQGAMITLMRKEISLTAAGRTDAGVHARQMFAHFDTDKLDDIDHLVYRLNALLPADIGVKDLFPVPEEAHARFSAVERSYEYWISYHKDPFLRDYALWVKQELDITSMNKAAELLLQHSDFESFSRSNSDVKTFICEVRKANWVQDRDKLIFQITADRFLRNMVRAVVGTLLQVGLGKISIQDVNAIIKSKDRGEAGASVAAKGLYLTRVEYPEALMVYRGQQRGGSQD
ncbi:tRNA pseudouridine(38-40) synthase TruA [Zeaxanthinibacter sp. PT1]|uniref:tRNA pseudouridine(38-40) synthase TruA n=1 Tax=Zeaxanthinibacter TaxID=561554 RepID=UPI0023493B08|nr:tRNA pseudouridine(38-40) synthase TruA [Zeaxanthinibacter sp. PT1]MDC6352415.1 tRNA pseudouridine(38-40) synthase TruA [Zeaxanthinibacter sp. PT1]